MNLRYAFTSAIVRDLMDIESARQAVKLTVLPPQIVERLRQEARVRSKQKSSIHDCPRTLFYARIRTQGWE